MNEVLSTAALTAAANKILKAAGKGPRSPVAPCYLSTPPLTVPLTVYTDRDVETFVNKPQRKPSVTTGNPCALHSTVAGVEIRITNGNRFFCVYKDKTAFPYIAGSSELKFDDSEFKAPQVAADKIQALLMKQIKLRMSRAYQQDLEDERNEELWKFTDEY